MEMEITEISGGLINVALNGRLDSPGVDRVETKFTAALVPKGALATVDLSKVEFVGSMGIRMFISVARALAKKQGKLVLYAPQPLVLDVFDTVSLGDIIPVERDAAAAIARAQP